jgi:hypothetical protein
MKKRSMKMSEKENKSRQPGAHGAGPMAPGQIKKGIKPSQIRYVGDIKLC